MDVLMVWRLDHNLLFPILSLLYDFVCMTLRSIAPTVMRLWRGTVLAREFAYGLDCSNRSCLDGKRRRLSIPIPSN